MGGEDESEQIGREIDLVIETKILEITRKLEPRRFDCTLEADGT